MPVSRRSLFTAAPLAALLARNPGSIFAQTTTPSASPVPGQFDPASERFTQMLANAPSSLVQDFFIVNWSDLERHFAAFPDAGYYDIEVSLPYGLTIERPAAYFGIEESLGFGFQNLRQTMYLGRVSHGAGVFRLNLDARSLPLAWETHGYEQVNRGFGDFWSIGEKGEIDLDDRIQLRLSERMNNISILDDERIAFAPTADLLGEMIGSWQNPSSELIDQTEPIGSNILEDAVNVWCIEGAYLIPATHDRHGEMLVMDILDESDDAVGPMPAIEFVATSTTEGASTDHRLHQSRARVSTLLKAAEDDQAEQIANVVQWRMENLFGYPPNEMKYIEAYDFLEIDVVEPNLVRVTTDAMPSPPFHLSTMIDERHALPFAFRPET